MIADIQSRVAGFKEIGSANAAQYGNIHDSDCARNYCMGRAQALFAEMQSDGTLCAMKSVEERREAFVCIVSDRTNGPTDDWLRVVGNVAVVREAIRIAVRMYNTIHGAVRVVPRQLDAQFDDAHRADDVHRVVAEEHVSQMLRDDADVQAEFFHYLYRQLWRDAPQGSSVRAEKAVDSLTAMLLTRAIALLESNKLRMACVARAFAEQNIR